MGTPVGEVFPLDWGVVFPPLVFGVFVLNDRNTESLESLPPCFSPLPKAGSPFLPYPPPPFFFFFTLLQVRAPFPAFSIFLFLQNRLFFSSTTSPAVSSIKICSWVMGGTSPLLSNNLIPASFESAFSAIFFVFPPFSLALFL